MHGNNRGKHSSRGGKGKFNGGKDGKGKFNGAKGGKGPQPPRPANTNEKPNFQSKKPETLSESKANTKSIANDVEESESENESGGEVETTKKAVEESGSESKEETKPIAKKVVEKGNTKVETKPIAKKVVEESDSESKNESESESKVETKPIAKKVVEENESESEEETKPIAKKVVEKKVEMKPIAKKVVEKKVETKAIANDVEGSDSESDGESESENQEEQALSKKRERNGTQAAERDSKKLKTTTTGSIQQNESGGKNDDQEMNEDEDQTDQNVGHRKSPNDELFKLPKTNYQVPIARDLNVKSKRLHLSNLPFAIEDSHLKKFFEECGEITIDYLKDKETKKFYGTAFVNFNDEEAAEKGLTFNGRKIMDRVVKIQAFRNSAKSPLNQMAKVQEGNAPPKECRTLFVGNISYDVTDEDIYELFSDFKKDIKQIRWVKDNTTGAFKGCGFVVVGGYDSVLKGVQFNGAQLKGKSIRVNFDVPKPRPDSQFGNKNNGNGKFGNNNNYTNPRFGHNNGNKFGNNNNRNPRFGNKNGFRKGGPTRSFGGNNGNTESTE